jgi:hypothetical protein
MDVTIRLADSLRIVHSEQYTVSSAQWTSRGGQKEAPSQTFVLTVRPTPPNIVLRLELLNLLHRLLRRDLARVNEQVISIGSGRASMPTTVIPCAE